MARAFLSIRDRLDRAGIWLSGLCAVHCLLGIVLVSVLGLGGELLLAPGIHEAGLAVAIVIALATLGLGILRHGRFRPIVIGTIGVVLMGIALVVGHGLPEALFTIAGVALLATGHILNLRHAS
jgi:uncharacterized membrane protein